MPEVIGAEAAKRLIHGAAEIALLDPRERGQFGEGHLFHASNCPYSRLELLAPRLVPKRDTPCLLIDGGDGLAERAARRLAALGYHRLLILQGGTVGWAEAGFTLFQGVGVPSKTFGELMEHDCHTPTITADELHAWQREGRRHLLLDARPFAEFRRMSLPGARCLPNGELLYRFSQVVPGPTLPIVINCAGRTRGLIGAQSLINAGVANPVYALQNGTQGWLLAGLDLERGRASPPMPTPTPAALEAGRARAADLARRLGVPMIDRDQLARWSGEAGRSLFLLDLRTAAEYEAGHLPGARHAPAGQLVQALDEWTAVRRARLVLIDDNGLRAVMAASWLRQMGRDAVAVSGALDSTPLETGPDIIALDESVPSIAAPCSAQDLARAQETGNPLILDLRPSAAYRAERIPGSRWATRSRLQRLPLAPARPIILVADAPAVAQLAALELREMTAAPIAYLEGGIEAWRGAGLPIDTAPGDLSDAEAIDFLFFAHGRSAGNLAACRQYLAWETGLTQQIDGQEQAELTPLVLDQAPAGEAG